MKSLSEKNARILRCCQYRADEPLKSLAKDLGMNLSTVHYHLSALKRSGIIRRKVPFINPYPLGYSRVAVYFSLATETPEARRNFLSHLIASEQVAWVEAVSGDFQYGTAFISKSPHSAVQVLSDISTATKAHLIHKKVSLRLNFEFFGSRHLAELDIPESTIGYGERGQRFDPDEVDLNILSALGNTPYESVKKLQKYVGLPFATLKRRIERLENAGVISGYVYRLDLHPLGYKVFTLLIQSRGNVRALGEQLRDYARTNKKIIAMIEAFGEWDYELEVELKNSEDISRIISELYGKLGSSLSSIRVQQNFRYFKYTGFPALDTLSASNSSRSYSDTNDLLHAR